MKKIHFLLSLFGLLLGLHCHAQNGIIINKYASVLSSLPCNTFTVDSGSNFAVGDTVLIIQMKGAAIDTSNTVSFGNILNYNNCGNYEYNAIAAINLNEVTLKYTLAHTYDIPDGKVQLIKVPSYLNYTVNQPHTCMQWNGTKGGVFAIYVTNTLTLNDSISVSGAGFAGGKSDQNPVLKSAACVSYPVDYATAPSFDAASNKGEGITTVPLNKSFGVGKAANGGGSGFSQNSGGGGGSNGNIGGQGGNEYVGCLLNPNINLKGGIGGLQLNYSNLVNKIFMGGGGGSGHVNNVNISNGGSGGGICIITAGNIVGNNKAIIANGADGLQCVYNSNAFGSCHDGMSGGGGGGVVLLNTTTTTGNLNIQAKGGKGANENGWAGYYEVGPGGGAGGGVIWFKNTNIPTNIVTDVNGGANGVVAYNNETWGALPGQPGQTLTNLSLLFPSSVFVNANLTADFSTTRISCYSYHFTNQSTASTGSINSYNWDFGDGTGSNQQNPTHTFNNYGSYSVNLTITGSGGCSATISKSVDIPYVPFAAATGDTSACGNTPIQLNATGGVSYQWTPATGLNNPAVANPIANISASMHYKVIVTDSFGCTDADSVIVNIAPAPNLQVGPDGAKICGDGSVQLIVTGVLNPQWSPANTLSNAQISNPVANPNVTTTYTVTGNGNNGCEGTDSITVFVYNNPTIVASADEDTINCTEPIAKLHANGGSTYLWSPSNLLNDPTSANPIANVSSPVTFEVLGTDKNGCINSDSVMIYISDNSVFFVPNAFSPNGDGLNDIFLPKYQCDMTLENFSIYNRFGQRIFFTTNKFKGWNGFQNSKDADVGTYFWYIQGHNAKHEIITRKGDLVLIR